MIAWVLLVLTILLLGAVAIVAPRWTVFILVAATALEISSLCYPVLGGAEEGGALSMVSLARLASAAVLAAGVWRIWRDLRQGPILALRTRLKPVLTSPLTIVLALFLLYGLIGLVYSAAPQQTAVESLRLWMLFAVFIAAALILEQKDVLLIFRTLHITALALAPLAFGEALMGKVLWQGQRLMVEQTLRINATFVDPNIYARYLVLAIAANLVLQMYCLATRDRLLYWAGLVILLGQLVLTGSRGGVLTLLAVLVLALILLPRRKAIAGLLAGVGVGGVVLCLVQPHLWQRAMIIGEIFTNAESQRLYLIKVALAIFRDHPLAGTGLGTFQTVFMSQYEQFKTMAAGAERSHTTVLTIAAEQGVIGLVLLLAVIAVLIFVVARLYADHTSYIDLFRAPNPYVLGAGCLLWIAAVFVSSQAEGRFFEDPLFWIASAALVVLGRERSRI